MQTGKFGAFGPIETGPCDPPQWCVCSVDDDCQEVAVLARHDNRDAAIAEAGERA